eukprot:gene17050-22560_t
MESPDSPELIPTSISNKSIVENKSNISLNDEDLINNDNDSEYDYDKINKQIEEEVQNELGDKIETSSQQNEDYLEQLDRIDNAIEALEIEQEINKDSSGELWPSYCDPSYSMPGEIEVRGLNGQIFYVKIIKQTNKKLFLGGYRNKLTGSIYHHASSQTPTTNKVILKDTSRLRTRQTQTTELRTLSQQTYSEAGTQMKREDLYLDNSRDKELAPKKYITADQVLAEKKLNCIIIQRYWRGVMARQRAKDIRMRNQQRDEVIRQEYELQQKLDRLKREEDMNRRLHPKTEADFEILFNELEVWSRSEIAKINSSNKSTEEKQKAKLILLTEKTSSIQSIQKLKQAANKDLTSYLLDKAFQKMAEPVKWELSSGDVALVETPQTLRAKDLMLMYNELCQPVKSVESRLAILDKVKTEATEFNHETSNKLIYQISKEMDLLSRNRPAASMKDLRELINSYFKDLIRIPEFNPRVSDVLGNKRVLNDDYQE